MEDIISPLSDTINIAASLDNDLENQMIRDKVAALSCTSNTQLNITEFLDSTSNLHSTAIPPPSLHPATATPNTLTQENKDDEKENMHNEDVEEIEADGGASNGDSGEATFASRPAQFALSRVKTIMKMDPEVTLASKESVFLIAKATVKLFLIEISFLNFKI
jgi:hypothetical protein